MATTMEPQNVVRGPGAPTRPVEHNGRGVDGVGQRGLMDLLKELRDEASELIENEIALAKTEISEKVDEARNGVISMATGSMVLMSGLVITLMAASAGLYTLLRILEVDAFTAGWLGPLIVGLTTMIIGAILVGVGKKKMEPDNLRPSRTQRSLHETKNWAERKV